MSSSSSVADSFDGFVWLALEALSRERGDCYARLAGEVRGIALCFAVDDERVKVVAHGSRFVRWRDGEAAVTVRATPGEILALVDGRDTLIDALLGERFDAQGTIDALTRCHDGLVTFLEGAVRCPGFPRLMREFRAWAAGRGRP